MNFTNTVKSFSARIYKNFADNPGALLLWTGTFGWALSSAAHIFSIVINKKVDKEQKKFMVPQEIADAAVNIASFFVLTKSATDFGEMLVKKGKLVTPAIKNFIEDKKLMETVKGKITLHDSEYLKETSKKFDKTFKDDYFNLFDGVSFVASTIGSIVSSNIITPILRNKFAADRQKQSIQKDKKHELGIPKAPVLYSQNGVSMADYQKKTLQAPRITTGGAMRV